MNYRKLISDVEIVLTLLILFTGCSSGKAPQLAGTSWKLTELNGSPALAGREPTLVFDMDRVTGSGSCNHFGGTYQVKGDNLTFGDLASTLMACAEGEVMQQESDFFAALQATARFEIKEGQLLLMDESGKVFLVFIPQ
jgi:heat shock protein HslJ